jgi:hypothetical protein
LIELYKAEFLRFARGALGLGVLHAAALLLLDRTFPWMRDDAEIAVVAAFAYALAGAIFGVYQCAGHARLSHWIALLHRPLAPWRIMAAVSGAGATVLFAAVSVPLLAFTAAISLQAGRVVDARHWPLALGGALFALVGFGLGSYLALAPRRYGWTALVAVGVLIVDPLGAGPAALWLPFGIVAVLALLMAGAFKPDRSLPPTQPALRGLTSGVAALSLYFLLVGGIGVVYPLGLAALGRDPVTNPRAGGVVEALRAESGDLIAAALANAAGPEAAAVRRQLHGAPAARLPVAVGDLPVRGEMTNSGPIRFTDTRRGIEWTFSHDRNAFQGLRLSDRRMAGELRPTPGFDAPPLLTGDGSMIAGARLYRFDVDSGAIVTRLELPARERIVARPVELETLVPVLGDRALYLFDRHLTDPAHRARPSAAAPLPGPIGDLQRLDMAQLPDRVIVSFLFGRDSIEGPSPAWQQVVALSPDGTTRALVERSLAPDHSAVLRFRSYWLSPALRVLSDAVATIGSGAAWIPPRAPVSVPRAVWIAAALLSLAAAAAAVALAAWRRMRRGETAVWALAVLAAGLPMLVAFWLTGARRPLTN